MTTETAQFRLARRLALDVMAGGYDPFHDADHALEVESTSLRLLAAVPVDRAASVDVEVLRLAAFWHDTSRRYIKHSLLLQPLLDGPFSGFACYRGLRASGYSRVRARRVVKTILGIEDFFGLVPRLRSAEADILMDADCLESLSARRLDRALTSVESGRHRRSTLNGYLLAWSFLLTRGSTYVFQHEESCLVYEERRKELFDFAQHSRARLRDLLYPGVLHANLGALARLRGGQARVALEPK
jgi:hypothetical protein